jgi:hypothetical protein
MSKSETKSLILLAFPHAVTTNIYPLFVQFIMLSLTLREEHYELSEKYLNFKDYVFGVTVTHTGHLCFFVRAEKSQKFGELQHVIQL